MFILSDFKEMWVEEKTFRILLSIMLATLLLIVALSYQSYVQQQEHIVLIDSADCQTLGVMVIDLENDLKVYAQKHALNTFIVNCLQDTSLSNIP